MDVLNAPSGIDRRIDVLRAKMEALGNPKLSHKVDEARELKEYLTAHPHLPPYEIFEANALHGQSIAEKVGSIDVIITDPPYARKSGWRDASGRDVQGELVNDFLNTTRSYLSPNGRVAIIFDNDNALTFKGWDIKKEVPLKGKRTGYLLVPT